jgi:hypothetical protein
LRKAVWIFQQFMEITRPCKNVWRRRSRFRLRTKFGITSKNLWCLQFMPIGVILKCTMIAEK